MFTVYSTNNMTKYLNTYTVNNSILFVPNKEDTYIITARIINSSNFGCMDLSQTVLITSA